MSQWGQEIRTMNARFLPLVESEPFEPATRKSVVVSVLLIDDGGHPEQATRLLTHLTKQQVGQPYGTWLDMPDVEHLCPV